MRYHQQALNAITSTRIILSLPLLICLLSKNNAIACLILLIAAITDFLDGYLARKYKLESVTGAILDPLADKIIILTALLCISKHEIIPMWAMWLIMIRELMVSFWRSTVKDGGPASLEGKIKTTLQFTSIVLLIWPKVIGTESFMILMNRIGLVIFWISLYLALSSGIKYIIRSTNDHPN